MFIPIGLKLLGFIFLIFMMFDKNGTTPVFWTVLSFVFVLAPLSAAACFYYEYRVFKKLKNSYAVRKIEEEYESELYEIERRFNNDLERAKEYLDNSYFCKDSPELYNIEYKKEKQRAERYKNTQISGAKYNREQKLRKLCRKHKIDELSWIADF